MSSGRLAVTTGSAGGFALGFVTPSYVRMPLIIALLFLNAALLTLNIVQHRRYRRALRDAESRLRDSMPALLATATIELERRHGEGTWLS
jgi:hypothetical protein